MKAGAIEVHDWKSNIVPHQTNEWYYHSFKTLLGLRIKGYQNRHRNYFSLYKKNIRTLYITKHAAYRWNIRIGPNMSLVSLQSFMNTLWCEPERMVIVGRNTAIIDNEIVFTFKVENDSMIVTTFYGRISILPALQSITNLHKLNDYPHQLLDLYLPEHVLRHQMLPILPMNSMMFSGSRFSYKLEEFLFDRNTQKLISGYRHSHEGFDRKWFLYTFINSGQLTVKELIPGQKLGKSVNSALRLLGQPQMKHKMELHTQ